jgi:hypothetical protein
MPLIRSCCGFVLEFFEIGHFVGNSALERIELLPSFVCSRNGGRERTRLAHQGEVVGFGRNGRTECAAIMVFELAQSTFDVHVNLRCWCAHNSGQ